jgi:hypothetical protein
MDLQESALATAAGVLAFFGGIGLLMWIDQRGKARQRELEHTERMKALELGHTLPDAEVARAQADGSRTTAAALVATFVSLILMAAASGATALVLYLADPRYQLALLCTIWGVCGLSTFIIVLECLHVMRRRGDRGSKEEPQEEDEDETEKPPVETCAGAGRDVPSQNK